MSRSGPRQNGAEKTYFEKQREALVGDIAEQFELVLQNINKLNRSLEGVIAVGNEFGSVEALWSQFENVMASGQSDEGQKVAEEGDDNAAQGQQDAEPAKKSQT